MNADKRTLEAYEKTRALEQELGRYGAKLDQDKLLEEVVEIRRLLESERKPYDDRSR